MRLYADTSARRTRQIVCDLITALWLLLWIWIAVRVHDTVANISSGSAQLESSGQSLKENMTAAADGVSGIPLIGAEVRKPFESAATAGDSMIQAGRDISSGMDKLGVLLAFLVVIVPLTIALLAWGFARIPYAIRASRVARLVRTPGGSDVLAARAIVQQPERAVLALGDDIVARWKADDPIATRQLSDLELAGLGLRRRPELA